MTGRRGVLCAGSVVLDVAKVIDALPARDRLAIVSEVSASTGGPAANLAVDLARLGAGYPLAIAGVIGDDSAGDTLVREFTALGIDTSRLRVSDAAVTSFTDAMVERDGGSRTFFHHAGANDLFEPGDVDLTATDARILHLGAPGLHARMDAVGGWARVLREARDAGLRTNLELVTLAADRIREVAAGCLPHLDSVVVNEIEAAALLDAPVPPAGFDGADVDWPALERLAAGLRAAGVRQAAVVHFPGGCVAADDDGLHRQPSVRLPRDLIRNATGAGDAFAAGVIHALHEDLPVPQGLRAGVCVAAASLTGAATSDGIGPLADCLALGERYGFRDG